MSWDRVMRWERMMTRRDNQFVHFDSIQLTGFPSKIHPTQDMDTTWRSTLEIHGMTKYRDTYLNSGLAEV